MPDLNLTHHPVTIQCQTSELKPGRIALEINVHSPIVFKASLVQENLGTIFNFLFLIIMKSNSSWNFWNQTRTFLLRRSPVCFDHVGLLPTTSPSIYVTSMSSSSSSSSSPSFSSTAFATSSVAASATGSVSAAVSAVAAAASDSASISCVSPLPAHVSGPNSGGPVGQNELD